jgi:hypothetical protein
MVLQRRIPLPVHALVELSAGLALVVASFALHAGPAGTVLMFVAGVLLAGTGLGALDAMPLAVHLAIDRWLAVAIALASVAAALSGGAVAAVALLACAALQLALTGITRWTRVPATR